MGFATFAKLFLALGACVHAENQGFPGLVGVGITLYDPPCAFACHDAIAYSPLACTSEDHGGGGHHASPTSNECYASDDAFLTTLAWCIKQRCQGVEMWKLEEYWRKSSISIKINPTPPPPKWTYQESLARVEGTPNVTLVAGEALNETMLVDETDYIASLHGNTGWETAESSHARSTSVLTAAWMLTARNLLTVLVALQSLSSL
jgi:hypothetical protein